MKDIIRKRREELNLTYEQLGNIVGVGKSTVRKWETGMIENMRRDNIVALAKALDISPAVIMGWEPFKVESNLSKEEERLISNFKKLNDLGKKEANKRIEELTQISTYRENELCATMVADENAPYLIAAHDDNLTDDEKLEMNKKIQKILEKRNRK
ncbi:helix-turn-helix transcriptional regulator [Clostridium botulinum]|nr:helix-turn-helix transcriptional regulator [Clostridium botulinum]MBZ1334405.1 helix-turn-helix transcriptional regulator [Clostridium botulinum]MBZ1337896.1 helix-turn-helix transcriptional regulator [Clostridium botulinum]MBZ1340430.1 helix-turn-helix transcriptional regulator [Clostridium botulinum]MBZ1344863.1 helix-turn-helix transcriptional regulator [Clostridium botulinum]